MALLLFASIAALRVPLAPALVHVSPDRIAPGPVELVITGYNTSFNPGVPPMIWLENGGERWCAGSVRVLDDRHLIAHIPVPTTGKEDLTSFLIKTSREGLLKLPSALWTTKGGDTMINPEPDCRPENKVSHSFSFGFPNRSILYESIRNLFFHVPMWFTMIALMAISVSQSIRVLGSNSLVQDQAAELAAKVGLVFCFLGLITGAVWARATWGAFWTNDVKLNGAAVTGLIYLAYLVLRGSVQDAHKRARLAAIYNIFAFVLLVLFLFVVPRLNAVDSLHPGNGGNSGFSDLDLDNRLRAIFYPAVLGWILLGVWMYDLRVRTARLAELLDR